MCTQTVCLPWISKPGQSGWLNNANLLLYSKAKMKVFLSRHEPLQLQARVTEQGMYFFLQSRLEIQDTGVTIAPLEMPCKTGHGGSWAFQRGRKGS